MSSTANTTVRLRIIVDDPPPGVSFAVQRGKSELLRPSSSERPLRFDLALRLGTPLQDGSPNFLGEFAQGSPADRFVYVNSGVRAGQTHTHWDRRAKLKLAGIPPALTELAVREPNRVIVARIPGTMKDGGPVCASIPTSLVTWSVVEEDA